ncbi:MAG: ABC transporter ATP-binding protein [Chloroflexi bacterium]|nr:ABC transporter ATP-binding protein [Chloroflexota bacterium]
MIRTDSLSKRYGRVNALDGLSITVPDGSIYGFIGQNGAGKTTTLRVLATLLLPDGGSAEVAGVDVLRQPYEIKKLVGYMPDFFGVYDDLKVGEYLEFYASLQGMRGWAAISLRDSLLELVDLAHKRDEYVEGLSRGMQQRLCLARALIHDPQVLLLDEPASGLDPIARVEMRELLKELGRIGKTILISSHILSELADLCTHIGIIASGRLLREGTVKDVLWAAERPAYQLKVLRDVERAVAMLESTEGIGAVSVSDGDIRFHCDGGAESAAEALAAVVRSGIPVVRFAEIESSLEATFLRLARNE